MRILVTLLSLPYLFLSCTHGLPVDMSYEKLGNKLERLDNLYLSNIPKDTINILAIGNSFAQDALFEYFFDMCKEKNTVVTVGVLHRSSCSLDTHLHYAQNDSNAYYFRAQNIDGSLHDDFSCPFSKAMKYADWDYVTLQQASSESGLYETYGNSIPALLEYIKNHTKNNVKIGWHQTWAYDQQHTPTIYNHQQKLMYDSIMKASSQAMEDYGFDFIVPSGTAIQNARNSIIGDHLNRDGFHLNDTGKYIAACTWAETITNKSVIGTKIKPKGEITEEDIRISQIAAHNAAAVPFEVTNVDYVYELNH